MQIVEGCLGLLGLVVLAGSGASVRRVALAVRLRCLFPPPSQLLLYDITNVKNITALDVRFPIARYNFDLFNTSLKKHFSI